MQLDSFCRPPNLKYNGNSYNFTYINSCYYIRPNTGNIDIDKYYIYANACYISECSKGFIVPILTYSLGHSDTDLSGSCKLRDIDDFVKNLNLYKLEDNIILHNYCCRRLREEINKYRPELNLISYHTKGSHS